MSRQACAALALVLICTSAVAAQGPTVFRARTDVVLVPVSVTDGNGRFVHGLSAEHFEILEGRARRPVKQLSTVRVPVSLIVLLDISGSMMGVRSGVPAAGRSHEGVRRVHRWQIPSDQAEGERHALQRAYSCI